MIDPQSIKGKTSGSYRDMSMNERQLDILYRNLVYQNHIAKETARRESRPYKDTELISQLAAYAHRCEEAGSSSSNPIDLSKPNVRLEMNAQDRKMFDRLRHLEREPQFGGIPPVCLPQRLNLKTGEIFRGIGEQQHRKDSDEVLNGKAKRYEEELWSKEDDLYGGAPSRLASRGQSGGGTSHGSRHYADSKGSSRSGI